MAEKMVVSMIGYFLRILLLALVVWRRAEGNEVTEDEDGHLLLEQITHKVLTYSNGPSMPPPSLVDDAAAAYGRRRGSGWLAAARNVNKHQLVNDSEAMDYLMDKMRDIPYVLYSALQNSSTSCADALTLLSNDTQMIQFTPTLSMTVTKETIAMDAFGKPAPEILKGNLKFNGGFDECITIDTLSYDFSMQYSDMGVMFVYVIDQNIDIFPLPMSLSLCMPDICTLNDINSTMMAINMLIMALPIPIKVLTYPTHLSMKATQNDIPLKFSTGAIVMICLSLLFVSLSLVATAHDLAVYYYKAYFSETKTINNLLSEEWKEEKQPLLIDSVLNKKPQWKTFLSEALESFSLYKTVPAILSTSQPNSAITSINGLRVISICWVILGHTYGFLMVFQAFKNQVDIFEHFVKRFSAQAILNAYFSVDSFFFLSGLLVAYLTLREMSRKRGRFPFVSFYVHRILRLTPTYMFVLFFYWFLAVHIMDGPEVLNTLGTNSTSYKNCRDYWWTNLLYINNFYPVKFDDQCMGWAWYLANDMQFYVISPLLLIPLYMALPSGLLAIGICLLSSVGVTGFIAGYYGYPANSLYSFISGKEILNDNLPDQSTEIYGKPYCRITPYIVGILLGYVLFKKYKLTFDSKILNFLFYAAVWITAAIIGVANVYGLYPTFHGYEFSAAENVIYYMFSRFIWGLTLFLVVYACHNGYGGIVNRFLSLGVWVPLSRLTYTAYLVHEIVVFLVAGEMRDSMYFTDMGMVVLVIANTVLSFGAAAMFTIFVEFPLSNLERAVFKLLGKPLRGTSTAGTRTMNQ